MHPENMINRQVSSVLFCFLARRPHAFQPTSNIFRFVSFSPFSFSKRWLIWYSSLPNSNIRSTPDLLDFLVGTVSTSVIMKAIEKSQSVCYAIRDTRTRICFLFVDICHCHLPMSSSVSAESLTPWSALPFLLLLPEMRRRKQTFR